MVTTAVGVRVIIVWNIASCVDNETCVHITLIVRNRHLNYSHGFGGEGIVCKFMS
jgi:hypothetical protein